MYLGFKITLNWECMKINLNTVQNIYVSFFVLFYFLTMQGPEAESFHPNQWWVGNKTNPWGHPLIFKYLMIIYTLKTMLSVKLLWKIQHRKNYPVMLALSNIVSPPGLGTSGINIEDFLVKIRELEMRRRSLEFTERILMQYTQLPVKKCS